MNEKIAGMILVIVLFVTIFRFLRFVIERDFAYKEKKLGAGSSSDVLQRLDRIEQRMANIETIVIEREKKSEFERSL